MTRTNRTITVDFHHEATYDQFRDDTQAFVEFVLAFLLALGFQLLHQASCSEGGGLTRHSPYARVRLGGLTLWRIQCTTGKAVFTVLPHFVVRYRTRRPDVAREALIAPHGGLSLACSAPICPISPMALSRVLCALGPHSLVTVLVQCRLPLPASILAEEQPSRCLTARVYLPTIVRGRVLWHLGYSDSKSAAAFTASYGQCQQTALEQEPSYQVKGALPEGFDRTVSSMRTLFPGARLGGCLRHALNKLPDKRVGMPASVRRGLRATFHALLPRCRPRTRLRVVALGQYLRHWATRIDTTVGEAHGERVRRWFESKKAGWYAVLEDPKRPAMRAVLDHAHNAMDRKLFARKGCHHSGGSQAAFLTGLAHLSNLIPYQRRAKNAALCGVEVEGGVLPTSDWLLSLPILTSGGYRYAPEPPNP